MIGLVRKVNSVALRRFMLLPRAERRLLIAAALTLQATRLGLWLLPFRALWRLLALASLQAQSSGRASELSLEQIGWALTTAGNHLPSTCLSQAIAAQILLDRAGFAPHLRIGVAKLPGGDLQAHAWVECQGRVVTGAIDDLSRYVALPLEGA